MITATNHAAMMGYEDDVDDVDDDGILAAYHNSIFMYVVIYFISSLESCSKNDNIIGMIYDDVIILTIITLTLSLLLSSICPIR